MPRVLVSASFPETLLQRQTPQKSGRWGEFEFLFEPDGQPIDAWVVYDELRQTSTQLCPPGNTVLITGEPPSLRRYRSRYTGQFGQIWTSHRDIVHPHVTLRNEAQHWHYAMRAGQSHGVPLAFEDLVALARPEKTKLMSVICSSKTTTADHRRRLDFVRYLKNQLGDQLDVFGSGIRPVADKSDAIWSYKYHIVLENDHSDYFMTEKLPDAYLGWSYPFYFGGIEACHRFPEGSFTAIDIYQPEQALNLIRVSVASQVYEHSMERITQARSIVLWKHNLFAMMAEYLSHNMVEHTARMVTLLPKSRRTRLLIEQFRRSLGVRPSKNRVA
jgi:Glycosyltransferase family 10 (fucosyltransferase) C-term